jgi:hypothetical protein
MVRLVRQVPLYLPGALAQPFRCQVSDTCEAVATFVWALGEYIDRRAADGNRTDNPLI